jgi:hypothetical protein
MNKDLITKLKEDAWLDAVAMANTEEHKCHLNSDYFRAIEQNRFAELVLAQALQHLDNIGHDASREALEKHFGVKA